MAGKRNRLIGFALGLAIAAAPRAAAAYSVLAHQAIVDAAWNGSVKPLLRRRFPGVTDQALARARAFAYGGSVIQDLGYYPFGSRLFTNLVHYVRSGDFVEALLRDARSPDEYAFALGALAHYTADNDGHPLGVNRAVPLVYPETRAGHGDVVTYEDSPKRHVMVEFGFDVVQLAGGRYASQAYRDVVGFEVSKPLVERAFRETYGLEMREVFGDLDLAIGTYRFAVAKLIPDMTAAAWRDKRDEIERVTPHVTQDEFVHLFNRSEYERGFGTRYRRPGTLARVLVWMFKVVPKVGPMRPLAFRPPTPEAERLFLASFERARDRYRRLVRDLSGGSLGLANTDFDTGQPTGRGEYRLADDAYSDLLNGLAKANFATVTPDLRRNIVAFFTSGHDRERMSRHDRKLARRARQQLASLLSHGRGVADR